MLFICHRQMDNKWADIAQVLEGRTDNTIKNHWNSSMRKLISNFEKEFEAQCRKHLADVGVAYQGNDVKKLRSMGKAYQQHIKVVEDQIKQKNIDQVRVSNEHFYMMKAKEYLDKKDDPISFAQAKLLLKKLNKEVKDMLPDHTPTQARDVPPLAKQNTRPTTVSAQNKHAIQTSQREAGKSTDLFHQHSKTNARKVNDGRDSVVVKPFSIQDEVIRQSSIV